MEETTTAVPLQQTFKIALIWAHDLMEGIGVNNQIPWQCKEDMRWFREKTTGHIVVMGRKTFESMGSKPLKNRVNIVISSTMAQPEDGSYIVVSTPGAALAEYAKLYGEKPRTLFIIGGSKIYLAFRDVATELYETLVWKCFLTDTQLVGTGGGWTTVTEKKELLEIGIPPGVRFRNHVSESYQCATEETPKQLTKVTFYYKVRK